MEKLIDLKHLFLIVLMTSHFVLGQDNAYVKGKEYVINNIKVTGIKSFNEQTVITYTGLFVGKKVQIPGEDISKIINKLWKLELFSDINFYITNIIEDKVDLEISIVELPSLSEYKITGLKKTKAETIEEEIEIKRVKLDQNLNRTAALYTPSASWDPLWRPPAR